MVAFQPENAVKKILLFLLLRCRYFYSKDHFIFFLFLKFFKTFIFCIFDEVIIYYFILKILEIEAVVGIANSKMERLACVHIFLYRLLQ